MSNETLSPKAKRSSKTAAAWLIGFAAGTAAFMTNINTIKEQLLSLNKGLFGVDQPDALRARLVKMQSAKEKVRRCRDYIDDIYGGSIQQAIFQQATNCRMIFRDDVFVMTFFLRPQEYKLIVGSVDGTIRAGDGKAIVKNAGSSDVAIYGGPSRLRYIVTHTEDDMGGGTGITRGTRTILPVDRQNAYESFEFGHNFHFNSQHGTDAYLWEQVLFKEGQLTITLDGFSSDYVRSQDDLENAVNTVSRTVIIPTRKWTWAGYGGYVQTEGPMTGRPDAVDTEIEGARVIRGTSLGYAPDKRRPIYEIH